MWNASGVFLTSSLLLAVMLRILVLSNAYDRTVPKSQQNSMMLKPPRAFVGRRKKIEGSWWSKCRRSDLMTGIVIDTLWLRCHCGHDILKVKLHGKIRHFACHFV